MAGPGLVRRCMDPIKNTGYSSNRYVIGLTRGYVKLWAIIGSGQIIATSHDLTPNGGLVREIPLFQGNLGW